MRNILLNAFSIQMIADHRCISLTFSKLDLAPNLKNFESFIGHEDLANLLGVKTNRVGVKLEDNDLIIVAQYVGDRLPEGSTGLPLGAKIEFWLVVIDAPTR